MRVALIEDALADPLDLPETETVMRLGADCTDAQALGAALDRVAGQWGRIDGVFLSTPFSDAQMTAPLALLGADQRASLKARCIAPLLALEKAASSRRLGFCMVQSSLSSVIGGLGLAAYAGAHHHADLLAAARARDGAEWYTIGWDALAVGPTPRGNSVLEAFALSPDQVWDATCRILGARLTGHSIVSRGDIDSRRAEWLNPAPRLDEETPATGRKRPALQTPFVAPRSPVEETVAGILQDLLGLDRIGVEDGFYELGGHSLLAIRAIARLREAFPVQIEMRELLLDNPSAASIAALIDSKLAGDDDLAALLAEVEGLSDDDLRAALAEEEAQ